MSDLEKAFINWIYKIINWKIKDFRKKQNAQMRIPKGKIQSINDLGHDEVCSNMKIESDNPVDEKKTMLNLLLGRLSSEERDLIVLHNFQKRTYEEIAQIINEHGLKSEELKKKSTALRKKASRAYNKLRIIIRNEPSARELFKV